MSTALSAALAAQIVLALALTVFAVRAWSRVRDGRTGLLAVAFILLLAQATAILLATSMDLLSLDAAVTIGTFLELGALLALYVGILRR
jgi:hypothetical protein